MIETTTDLRAKGMGLREIARTLTCTLLRVTKSGYVDSSVDDSAAVPTISILKSLLYLGTLLGVFTRERPNSPWGGEYTSELFFTDDVANDGFCQKIKFPHEVGVYLWKYTVAKKTDRVTAGLICLKKFFSSDLTHVDILPLVTAAEWAFDSAASSNETVSFIQLCIGLEAILGDDKTTEGITKSLSDRCAYLLGKNLSEREVLREKFEALYKHRSKIVHGRRVRLGKDAEDSLYWGRSTLNRILKKEFLNIALPDR